MLSLIQLRPLVARGVRIGLNTHRVQVVKLASCAMSHSSQKQPETVETDTETEQLAIEEGSSSSATNHLRVGGEAVKLESLGPVVINANGTLSRLNNWHEMTEPEKCATKRMIAKRNEVRRQTLAEQGIVVGQTISN